MVTIKPKNLLALPGLFKLPELVFSLTILLLTRASPLKELNILIWGSGDTGDKLDAFNFGTVMVYGFFIIILAQLIGYLASDQAHIQNLFLNLIGAIGFIAAGSVLITENKNRIVEKYKNYALADGSMCIIQGILMLLDTAFCAIYIVKEK